MGLGSRKASVSFVATLLVLPAGAAVSMFP